MSAKDVIQSVCEDSEEISLHPSGSYSVGVFYDKYDMRRMDYEYDDVEDAVTTVAAQYKLEVVNSDPEVIELEASSMEAAKAFSKTLKGSFRRMCRGISLHVNIEGPDERYMEVAVDQLELYWQGVAEKLLGVRRLNSLERLKKAAARKYGITDTDKAWAYGKKLFGCGISPDGVWLFLVLRDFGLVDAKDTPFIKGKVTPDSLAAFCLAHDIKIKWF